MPQTTTTVPQAFVTFFILRLEMVSTISCVSFASGPRLLSDPVQPHWRISFITTAAITLRHFYSINIILVNCRIGSGSTVQEYGLARFARYNITVAFPIHSAVSSIDGSSQSRLYNSPIFFFIAGTLVEECGRARFTSCDVNVAPPSHYAVSNIDGSSQSQVCDLQTRAVARRPIHPKAFYLLSDVCSHTIWLNKCDVCMLRSPSITTCWARYGNVEFRGFDPIKPSAISSNFILRTSLEVKLELEIHLVSSVSLVGFKAECARFNDKSSQIGLYILDVGYDSGASHLKFLLVNNATLYRCINVVFDY